MNAECRMSNVEGMYSIFFNKEIERSDSILRYSLFDILRFAVYSGPSGGQSNQQETVPFWRSFIQGKT